MAQDLYFSQFFETPMLRNPALAGIHNGDYRIQSVYRSQWTTLENPFHTGSLNLEKKTIIKGSNDFFTLGLQLLFDRAGAANLTSGHLLPVVNYHKSISEERNSYISLGFFGGMVTRTIDRSKMTTDNQYNGIAFDPTLPNGETFSPGYKYFDAGVGMSFNSTIGEDEKHLYFLGVSYHHMNKPLNSFFRDLTHLPKWILSAGLKLQLSPVSSITLHGDHLIQLPYKQLMFGGLYTQKFGGEGDKGTNVHFGIFSRWKNAIVPMVKFDLKPIQLGLSYDVNMGNTNIIHRYRGGFEVSLSYMGFVERENSSQHATRCPKF